MLYERILIGNQRFRRGWLVSAKFWRSGELPPQPFYTTASECRKYNFVVDSIYTTKLCSRHLGRRSNIQY